MPTYRFKVASECAVSTTTVDAASFTTFARSAPRCAVAAAVDVVAGLAAVIQGKGPAPAPA